jgi:hypothetical protein
MVTTTTGTVEFTSVKNPSKKYTLSAFCDDVTNTLMPINLNGLAVTGGLNFWTPPEDVYLSDVSFITGPTVVKVFIPVIADGNVAGKVTQLANVINTIQKRSFASLVVAANTKTQFLWI